MKIWALKAPPCDDCSLEEYKEVTKFLSKSIRSGVSRFGWGYMNQLNLNYLSRIPFDKLDEKEKECWQKTNFLLDIKKGDWVVHINLPYWGACLAAQVFSTYEFDEEYNEVSDYRHLIKIDTNTLVQFERDAYEVLLNITSCLKLRKAHWQINYSEDFLQTIENLNNENFVKNDGDNLGVFYLKKTLNPIIKSLAVEFHKSHHGGYLKNLIAGIFKKIPNVIKVEEYGKSRGWRSDDYADLIITYRAGLNVANLEKKERLVVQVKSFEGEHWEANAVKQIEKTIQEYNGNAGLIITPATATKNFQEEIEELSKKIDKPIGLIAGEDVAKFVLKYGSNVII